MNPIDQVSRFCVAAILFGIVFGAPQARAQKSHDAADAAVANCLEDHIATGQYFLVNLTTGTLNVKASSLKLITSCQNHVSLWINQCERETGKPEGCTRISMSIAQTILRDAYNHRNNLKKWRSR
jgi:hypothetical protein